MEKLCANGITGDLIARTGISGKYFSQIIQDNKKPASLRVNQEIR
ncbi:MAG: hypothetical protein ABF760_02770 [Zymomonas mobilis]|nr:hypothetical protein [Zymomonas mobilis]